MFLRYDLLHSLLGDYLEKKRKEGRRKRKEGKKDRGEGEKEGGRKGDKKERWRERRKKYIFKMFKRKVAPTSFPGS